MLSKDSAPAIACRQCRRYSLRPHPPNVSARQIRQGCPLISSTPPDSLMIHLPRASIPIFSSITLYYVKVKMPNALFRALQSTKDFRLKASPARVIIKASSAFLMRTGQNKKCKMRKIFLQDFSFCNQRAAAGQFPHLQLQIALKRYV